MPTFCWPNTKLERWRNPEYGARMKLPQLFIQDDIKIKPNLTVNVGLRYQITTGWSEVHGNEAAFDPTVVNPANNQLGAIWYGFSHANGRHNLVNGNYSTVLPRFGFSYQPNPVTVLRGGFGIYASTWSIDTYGGGMGGAFGQSGNYTDTTNGLCPLFSSTQMVAPPTRRTQVAVLGSTMRPASTPNT